MNVATICSEAGLSIIKLYFGMSVFTPKQHVKRSLRHRRHFRRVRSVVCHPFARVEPPPWIQRNVHKRRESARVDWSSEPGSMARGGAGSFARLLVPLWPPSRLDYRSSCRHCPCFTLVRIAGAIVHIERKRCIDTSYTHI